MPNDGRRYEPVDDGRTVFSALVLSTIRERTHGAYTHQTSNDLRSNERLWT